MVGSEPLGFHEEYIFPALLNEKADLFNFDNCAFSVKKAKESTMRVVMWKEIDITNSYTCEASFCGPDQGKFADYHFNQDLLQEMGHRICDTIYDYCDPNQKNLTAIIEKLRITKSNDDDGDSDDSE